MEPRVYTAGDMLDAIVLVACVTGLGTALFFLSLR